MIFWDGGGWVFCVRSAVCRLPFCGAVELISWCRWSPSISNRWASLAPCWWASLGAASAQTLKLMTRWPGCSMVQRHFDESHPSGQTRRDSPRDIQCFWVRMHLSQPSRLCRWIFAPLKIRRDQSCSHALQKGQKVEHLVPLLVDSRAPHNPSHHSFAEGVDCQFE